MTEMEASLLNFENGLASIQQFEIRKMNSKELNNAVYDYINLSYDTPVEDATEKVVNPMAITQNGEMKIGQQYVSMLSLTIEGSICMNSPFLTPVKHVHTVETLKYRTVSRASARCYTP